MTHHTFAAALLAAALLAACSNDTPESRPDGSDVAAGRAAVADTGAPLGATPTAGGFVSLTPGDVKATRAASEYQLTEQNFMRFVAATDSLAALRRRDPQVAAFFDAQVSDNGSGTQTDVNNAGRKRMEDHPAISTAIAAAGMSVKDYVVASVAIAQAQRFMGNPEVAPANPVLGDNARFLNANRGHLDHLAAASRRGAVGATTTTGAATTTTP